MSKPISCMPSLGIVSFTKYVMLFPISHTLYHAVMFCVTTCSSQSSDVARAQGKENNFSFFKCTVSKSIAVSAFI